MTDARPKKRGIRWLAMPHDFGSSVPLEHHQVEQFKRQRESERLQALQQAQQDLPELVRRWLDLEGLEVAVYPANPAYLRCVWRATVAVRHGPKAEFFGKLLQACGVYGHVPGFDAINRRLHVHFELYGPTREGGR